MYASRGDDKLSSAPETKNKNNNVKSSNGVSSFLQKKIAESASKNRYVNVVKTGSDNASSKSNSATKNYTDFNTETKNAYATAKNKANSKTTITSNLSEKERKARIKEIESEMKQLNYTLEGLGRAGSYGGKANQEWLKNKSEETKKRKAELSAELKSLERVGTFTASELKQFEIEDAKTEKAMLPNYNPTARVAPSQVDAFVENAKAHTEYDKEIETLERQKKLYDSITKYGDVVNEDDFWGQWKANYRKTRLSEESGLASSKYQDNPTEENRDLNLAYDAFTKEYMKNNENALDDEGQVLPLLSETYANLLAQKVGQSKTAIPLGIFGAALGAVGGVNGIKAGWTAGNAIGTGYHSYNVIRGNLFNELISYGLDEETAKKLANDDATIEALIESGETVKDWAYMLYGGFGGSAKTVASKAIGKTAETAAKSAAHPLLNLGLNILKGQALNAGTEGIEEGLQGAVSRGTREKALSMIDNEIGQYGEGNIDLYNRPIYKNSDGTISTVDSVTFTVDDKYVVLPTIVRDENGNAQRLNTDEEIWEHYQKTGEYLGEFDSLEQANIYANRLHSAQAYVYSDSTTVDADDSVLSGSVKVLGDAFFGGNIDALKEIGSQSWEGVKGGFVSGGVHGTVKSIVSSYAIAKSIKEQNEIADFVRTDEESLDALIEEGKASGKGTVSEKIATEIETAREKGKEVTREQVKRLIASNDVYIENEEQNSTPATLEQAARDVVNERNADTSILQRVELLSMNGEQISVEEAQEASGYGENGARVLAESVNSAEGRSFSEIKSEMHNAYLAGRSNKRVNPESFSTDIELKAYAAGRQDGELGRIKLQESRGSVENKTDGEKITLTNTDDNSMIKSRFRNDADGKIRFNQENIDYENSSYREESFNLIGQSNGNVETTKGGVVGKYGVHKKSNGYYGVTLLSAGMDIAAFETESEAALFATYANETIPFNDISFVRNADGRIVVDTSTAEFMQYGEQINELKDNKPYLQDTMGTFDDVSFSIENISGEKQSYGEGVCLDTDIFDGIKPRNWNKVLAEFVYNNLAGESITVYNADGITEEISFAKLNERVVKKGSTSSRKVIDKLARAKGNINSLAIVHIDELLQTSRKFDTNAENSHQWLDKNGWEIKKAYMIDKRGRIYETLLNIAKAKDGRNILYALSNTKKVDDGEVLSTSNEEELAHNTNFSINVSQYDENVNRDLSERKGNINEEGRDDTLSGSLGRSVGESAGKPSRSIPEATGKVQEDGGARTDTESSRRIYAENVRAVQGTEVRRQGPFQCEFIKPEYYTDDMRAIEEENKAQGLNTYFFFGGGKYKNKFIFRGAISKNDVYIRCDHAKYSPEQINKHEKVHHKYKTKEIEKIRNYIEKRLTKAEKEHIINTMYARYSLACKGNPNKIFEEFVCDVLADMNDYGAVFKDIADAYWNNDTDLIDSYTAADYAESIDAGGNQTLLDNIGIGGEYRLSESGEKYGQTGDNRKGTERIPERVGNQGRGDTSNPENLSNGNSKREIQNPNGNLDEKIRRTTKGSSVESVEGVALSTVGEETSGRTRTNGERFLVALRNGDEETARTLLNEQAIKNGFVPANMYHGTLSDDVFTQFESEVGIHWVTSNLDYAEEFSEGYFGDDVKAEQLFTEPDSGIYDLYIKPGKVLDVGDTNANISTLKDIYDFGKRIGFSDEEILRCWNEGRVYEHKQLWTVVHTLAFANIAREHGYDSIRATEKNGVETYGCLYPENLKSAKLETFDDDGNLIPLEERFNSEDIDLRFSLDEDGEYDLFDIWKSKVEEFGVIPKGEKPARDIDVPKKIAKDKKVSQTVRTILEAKATPDNALPTIEKMVLDGAFSYDTYTDKQAIADAEGKLKEDGWLKSYNKWMKDVEKGTVSKQHTVLGWALYNNAVNRATETTSEDERKTAMETALDVLDAMVRHQRSAAQALQATRVLKKLSPETQLYGVQKSVNAFQEELTAKYGKKAPDLKIDEELAEKFLNAKTEDERNAVETEIYKDIGRQMPSNWLDKWNAWRYVAMLANPRTHIRNIVGNAAFMPAVAVKDLTATAIETAVNRLSGKKILRNKALITGNKADRALLKAAWNDYGNVADMISNGGKYNDSANPNQHIEEGRQIFKTKPIEWVRKKNSQALEKEDMWFSKPHYAYALAQYCKANNITSEQIAKGKAIALAREYAIREAQKATYRDTNAFSQLVSNVGRNNMSEKNGFEKAVGVAIEGALPFRKTPANILVRGVEYSPLGLVKGLSYDLYKVSKGEMSAAEAIDNISAGLTGTGLLVLGVFLAAQGLIRGHGEDEEKEKKFKELMGHQSYSLELKNGQSITLDWLAPEALPFFVGVNIYEATRGSDEEVNMSSILEAVSGITEPMLEMSCLQGINDLIESFGYASSNDTSGLVSILSSTVTSYLTQGIPTIFGQIERTGEKNRMTTYTEKNAFLTSDMQYTLGKISAKIPFLDYNQIPYIDAWGRKEASGMALKRGLNNFLNPAYTSTIETSRMEKELLRLFEKTGEGGVFPSRADKYFKVDGVRKDLTADEYVRYATLKGEKSYKLVSDLVKSNAYKKLSDDEKVKAIEEAYDYANQKAKQTISNYKPDAWVKKADAFGANVGNYISFKTEVSGTKEENGGKISKQEVADIILDMAQNDSETWKMYLSMYDSEKDKYAYNKGIDGETYMYFLEALNDVDEPTESGKYGTYNQKEAQRAVGQLSGLSREEKAVLWQSVNTSWKRNPFR